MSSLLDTVLTYMESDEWPIAVDAERQLIWSGFACEAGQWRCCIRTHEEQQQITVYSFSPLAVPPFKRAPLAEYITRANYGLINGNFELDIDDGELRYKTSLDLTGLTISDEALRRLFYSNVLTMARYLPGIAGIIQADAYPAVAVAEAEGLSYAAQAI